MKNVESGDGEHHWLADQLIDNDADREPKYGAECTKWLNTSSDEPPNPSTLLAEGHHRCCPQEHARERDEPPGQMPPIKQPGRQGVQDNCAGRMSAGGFPSLEGGGPARSFVP
ncbi:hypothetical protein [Actinoplanes sp. L3-i22]|uniref:hypothetical protein n=1 Tax=Actinoplanes sp. L3-i22 TaxID=2836373 RepID=UPI001C7785C5|nr:hypothetical protein [Actinoplanes sp. L3-i22]BCY08921.1 hypothetical protein L3i22_040090 [Actinoplanes sp. L3-i22]